LTPIDLSELQWGSITITTGRNCTNFHLVEFHGDNFIVDGGPMRDATDPNNVKFLEDIKNYKLPEEFAEDGLSRIYSYFLSLMVRFCFYLNLVDGRACC
ncbi:hypothetical protein MKW94_008598, partial [Papaver nudicaule]|nr:hypothetical protein [Papaver nudicaule]